MHKDAYTSIQPHNHPSIQSSIHPSTHPYASTSHSPVRVLEANLALQGHLLRGDERGAELEEDVLDARCRHRVVRLGLDLWGGVGFVSVCLRAWGSRVGARIRELGSVLPDPLFRASTPFLCLVIVPHTGPASSVVLACILSLIPLCCFHSCFDSSPSTTTVCIVCQSVISRSLLPSTCSPPPPWSQQRC